MAYVVLRQMRKLSGHVSPLYTEVYENMNFVFGRWRRGRPGITTKGLAKAVPLKLGESR
jgi:hypothetical protein